MTAPSALLRRMVRKSTESQMNSHITILRGAVSALNTTTGLVGGLSGATTIYTGKARIHTVAGSGPIQNAGGPIDTRRTIISIPIDSAVPFRDDLITIQSTNRDSDGSESDANLDTRIFRVLDVDGGSYFGDARRMTCTQFYDSRYWAAS